MILSTHAVVGGAIASLIPSHPILVAALSFASHFAVDAVPHWDYPLRSISVRPNADNWALEMNGRLFRDLALIGFDACGGTALTLLLFASPSTIGVITLGAFAGMLPDALQMVHSLYPREPMGSLQRFHRGIHTKRPLGWKLGASSQAIFAAAVAGAALLLH
jgi:hypothetical protein